MSRPASSRPRRIIFSIRAMNLSSSPKRLGNHSSANAITRSPTVRPLPPSNTGGCGSCTGLGQAQVGSKSTWRPWYSASSSVQIAFIASTRSRSIPKRLDGSVP